MDFDDIISAYERAAKDWAKARDLSLYEAPVLAEAMAGRVMPRVLDLGCGTGLPLAGWFHAQGAKVTGVDGAAAMITLFQQNLPQCTAILADMRQLNLGQTFDVILAWDSFFHLSYDAQRAMFPIFARHAAPSGRLLFTTGDRKGTPIGQVGREPVIHASFEPEDYQKMLSKAGFETLWFRPNDPRLNGRSAWLAQFQSCGGIEYVTEARATGASSSSE